MRTCCRTYGTTLLIAAAVSMCCAGTAIAAMTAAPPAKQHGKHHAVNGPLTGNWSGSYSGAFTGTFKLHWTQTGSRLHGSITLSKPSGTYGINGKVRGKTIGFGAVGAGATYAGTVSGTSMSGRYRSAQGGGPWSAHKTS